MQSIGGVIVFVVGGTAARIELAMPISFFGAAIISLARAGGTPPSVKRRSEPRDGARARITRALDSVHGSRKHPLPVAARQPLLTARMTFTIRPSDYYYANVRDELGAAYRVLSQLAERGVNLLAFTAVPAGPSLAQFALFPTEPAKLVAEAGAVGLVLDGPHHALVVQGDDELGAFASVHERLLKVGVDIYATAGVIDGRGSFGYVLYVREDQFERAAEALRL
jgi:hypothetical protein